MIENPSEIWGVGQIKGPDMRFLLNLMDWLDHWAQADTAPSSLNGSDEK